MTLRQKPVCSRPRLFAEFAGGAGVHEHVVVVEVAGPPLHGVVARAVLLVDVGHVLLAEGAVVEPVVARPAIDHRVHRDGDFEGGVRMDEAHQGGESVVGDADDADLAVALGRIFYEPVDGVVGVGGVVDLGWVEGAAEGAVHHVVAFGAVLAADVLDDADVAAVDDDVGGVVVAVEAGAEVRALRVCRQRRCAVGRAGEQDGRVFCSFRDQDDGVELDAVAHRDHDFAAVVVEAVVRRLEGCGRLARQGGGGLGGCEGEQDREKGGDEQTSAEQKRGHMFLFMAGTGDISPCRACLERCQSADGIICGDCGGRAVFLPDVLFLETGQGVPPYVAFLANKL